MSHFWQLVYEHRFAVGSVLWYIFSALIVTMPAKGEAASFYDWLYDFMHLLLNLKPIPALRQTEQKVLTSGNTTIDTAKTTEQAAPAGVNS